MFAIEGKSILIACDGCTGICYFQDVYPVLKYTWWSWISRYLYLNSTRAAITITVELFLRPRSHSCLSTSALMISPSFTSYFNGKPRNGLKPRKCLYRSSSKGVSMYLGQLHKILLPSGAPPSACLESR